MLLDHLEQQQKKSYLYIAHLTRNQGVVSKSSFDERMLRKKIRIDITIFDRPFRLSLPCMCDVCVCVSKCGDERI